MYYYHNNNYLSNIETLNIEHGKTIWPSGLQIVKSACARKLTSVLFYQIEMDSLSSSTLMTD